MRLFLHKYCAQAGALPQTHQLGSVYVPRLFDAHFTALNLFLPGKPVTTTAEEMTDARDQPYLIDVV